MRLSLEIDAIYSRLFNPPLPPNLGLDDDGNIRLKTEDEFKPGLNNPLNLHTQSPGGGAMLQHPFKSAKVIMCRTGNSYWGGIS